MMVDELDAEPREAARVQAENETLAFERALLQREVDRLTALTRMLEGRLSLAVAERDRLRTYVSAIEKSRPWRLVQALRGMIGRRW